MDIGQLINERFILFDEQIRTKEELFAQASVLFESSGVISNIKKYKNDLFRREKQTSTGIEDHFGIPHAKVRQY